jgi:hypothetical protein
MTLSLMLGFLVLRLVLRFAPDLIVYSGSYRAMVFEQEMTHYMYLLEVDTFPPQERKVRYVHMDGLPPECYD